MLFIAVIAAAPRAAAAASGDSAASSAIAATTSALRDATAAASAVPHACCGLSEVELVIAPRLIRRSLACSGRRSLRRSIDMEQLLSVRGASQVGSPTTALTWKVGNLSRKTRMARFRRQDACTLLI